MKKYSLTSEVIDQLVDRMGTKKAIKKNDTNTTGFNTDRTHVLVVFTGTDYGLNETLIQLVNAKKNYGFSYDIGFSFSGALVIGEREIDDIINKLNPKNVYYEEDQLLFEEVISNVEGILVPMSTQDTVAKLALGIQDSFISTLLWQSIWRGKSVLMDFDNVVKYKGTESKSKAQQRIVEEHVSKAIELGVADIERQDYIVGMLNEFKNANIKTEKKDFSSEQTTTQAKDFPKILTSKDLLELVGASKSLKIPGGTIVTPLAIDTAKEKQIEIIKE